MEIMDNFKIDFREMLIVAAEFVCAMACVPCIIGISTLIVTFVRS